MHTSRLMALVACIGTFGCLKASLRHGISPIGEVERQVVAAIKARDEALWNHWTAAAPLNLSKVGHEALFSRRTIMTLRDARRRLHGQEARRAARLELWLTGEFFSQSLTAENAAIARLRHASTFTFYGREVRWNDLPRLLFVEESAVKRRALWEGSLTLAERIDEALARKERRGRAVAAALHVPSTLHLAARLRRVELDELEGIARLVLHATELPWCMAVKRQSQVALRLPFSKLVRADLPRLMQFTSEVDAAFPREQHSARLNRLLDALAVDREGLRLDFSQKHLLPLLVAPSRDDVRISFQPQGGLWDQISLLSELGAALALAQAPLVASRLGDPASALVLAELFAGLVGTPEWLDFVGISRAVQPAVIDAWMTRQLFMVRRAAGIVLVHLKARGMSEAAHRMRFVALMSRAFGVAFSMQDGVRWRIDTDDFLHAATQLKAIALAQVVRQRLPVDWFASAQGWQRVASLWAQGSTVPLKARIAPFSVAVDVLSKALDSGSGGHAAAQCRQMGQSRRVPVGYAHAFRAAHLSAK